MVGFVGTPRFTHSDIFKKKKKYENDEEWKSKPEYDFCALALTLAALTTQGLHLWDSFPPSNYYCEDEDDLFESWVEDRGDVAWERLQLIVLVGLQVSENHQQRAICMPLSSCQCQMSQENERMCPSSVMCTKSRNGTNIVIRTVDCQYEGGR
eukprot:scaffold3590_cov57-Cylindrotheca_fusiformis.AAC.1